ncbi:MAG TPA: transglutaminase-like domain-containing protein [Candidatus Binatia bacterium]
MAHDPYREFRQAVDRPEDQIDLGRAALTIALSDYPNLNITGYLARIDRLAVDVSQRRSDESDAYHSIATLNDVLFKQQGFRGNAEDYYDPKNSFLNEVLERKTGIPITLSVLYIEVAQRIGLDLEGVNFPGHFLVKHQSPDGEIVIDPFHGGAIQTAGDLGATLKGLYGANVTLKPEFLEPASKKQILKRMLGNLKTIYLRDGEFGRALSVCDRLIILDPAAADEVRDRGAVYLKLEIFNRAREDFETYLGLAPDARDTSLIRDQLITLAKRVTLIH